MLLRNQDSCMINGGTTTKNLILKKGARQGDPISAKLFILVLEIAFLYIKRNKILRPLILLTTYFYILLMPTIKHIL